MTLRSPRDPAVRSPSAFRRIQLTKHSAKFVVVDFSNKSTPTLEQGVAGAHAHRRGKKS